MVIAETQNKKEDEILATFVDIFSIPLNQLFDCEDDESF